MIEKFSVFSDGSLRGRLVWLVYFLLGLCLVYLLFYMASYFGLSFFVLSNRGMVEHGVSGGLFSTSLDRTVWACAVLGVLAWLFYGLSSGFDSRLHRFLAGSVLFCLVGCVCLILFGFFNVVSLVLVSVFVIGLCVVFSSDFFGISRLGVFLRLLFNAVLVVLSVELAALVLFNVPVSLNLGSGVPGLHWGNAELVFSNLAYPFLPYLYLLFVLLGIVGFVIKLAPPSWLSGKIRGGWFKFVHRLSNVFELSSDGEFEFLSSRVVPVLAVSVSAIVSCLFVVFTVLPWANPTHMLVSVDSPGYYQWILYMRSVDVNSALSFAFANDRALFLVLGYALSFIASPAGVVQFAAAILIVLFGFVSFLVLKLFCSFREIWVLGVLLVPFSFQALGLIYSGFFANMLALILVLVYVVLFFRLSARAWSSLGFFALLALSVLILFSHSWTWFVFALSLMVFLFLEWRLAARNRGLRDQFRVEGIFVGATVGVGLFCDLVRKMFSPVSSTASVFSTAQSSLSFPNPAYLLSGMRGIVDFALGGVFANQLLIILSIMGFLVLLKSRSEVSNFFVSWIFVACATILFAAQDLVFDRLLFLMPWVILSSLGLFSVVRFFGSMLESRGGKRVLIATLVLVAVFLVLLNFSLRFLFNISAW